MTRKLILGSIFFFAFLSMLSVVHGQTIGTIDQWVSTTTPSASITQRSINKAIKITGLATGQCLGLDSNSLLIATTCGSGSSLVASTYDPMSVIMGGTSTTAVLQSATSTLYINKIPFFYASTTNFFIGSTSPRAPFNTGFPPGIDNIGFGDGALASTRGGAQHNLALGQYACQNTGSNVSQNICIGWETLENDVAGSNNTVVGVAAGQLTTAGDNAFFGSGAGISNITGVANTALGFQADFDSDNLNGAISLGAFAHTNCSHCFTVGGNTTSGDEVNVGFGTTTPSTVLDLGFATGNNIMFDLFGTSTIDTPSGINIKKGCYAVNGTCIGSGGGTPGGSNTQVQFNNSGSFGGSANLTWDGTALITPANTTNSTIRAGSIALQDFGLNNAWIAENTHYNGSDFVYDQTGYASLFYFSAGEGQFRIAGTGSAGASTNLLNVTQFKVDSDGSVAFGPMTSNAVGNFTGASLIGTAAGNIGIATVTPSSLLSVGNTNGINFRTSTSTFSSTGGLNISAGCYAINGTCMGAGGGGGSGTVNSGIFGQAAYYGANGTAVSGTTTLVIGTTTPVANNVGVGSSSPYSALSVSTFAQQSGSKPLVTVASTTGSTLFNVLGNGIVGIGTANPNSTNGLPGLNIVGGGGILLADNSQIQIGNANTAGLQLIGNVGNIGLVGTMDAIPLVLRTNSTEWMRITSGGRVGIDYSSPNLDLDVHNAVGIGAAIPGFGTPGIVFTDSSLGTSNPGAYILDSEIGSFGSELIFAVRDGPGNLTKSVLSLYGENTGEVGIGSTTPFATLSVQGLAQSSTIPLVMVASTTKATVFDILGNGLVGIGLTNPTATLHIQPSQGTAPLLVASSTGSQVFSVDKFGHVITGGNVPTAGTCGSSPTLDSNSTDESGNIQVGTGVSTLSCAVNFGATWATKPNCTANDDSSGISVRAVASVGTLTFQTGSSVSGDVISWICLGGRN